MIARARRGAGPADLDQALAALALLGLLAGLWAGVGLGPAGFATGVVYAVGGRFLLDGALRRARRRSLRPADRVTLARAVLVGGVTAVVADRLGGPAPVAVLVALATVALLLDAVDGRVARRTATVSALGARFDMEVDAFLILVLSVHVAFGHGAWVLAIGVMRYAFVVATWVTPWMRAPVPSSTAGKTVAAVQGVVLVVASAGVLPPPVAGGLLGAALAALVWSFGRDVWWLWRIRGIEPTPTTRAQSSRRGR